MRTKTLSSILLLLALGLLLPSGALSGVVGHITQVEGMVDLLKKGQLPATPVKLQDGLETGDEIRTKSLSEAQITFVDNSTLTIGPESRIAIEEYMVDEGKGKRNAVLKMFQGQALAVVSRVYQSKEPDFVVKTDTAIMGTRGTEVGVRLYDYSEFLDFEGRVRVQSISPQIQGVVELGPDQGIRVNKGLPPTASFTVGTEGRQQFMNKLKTGLIVLSGPQMSQVTAEIGGPLLSYSMINNEHLPIIYSSSSEQIQTVIKGTTSRDTPVKNTNSVETALAGKGFAPEPPGQAPPAPEQPKPEPPAAKQPKPAPPTPEQPKPAPPKFLGGGYFKLPFRNQVLRSPRVDSWQGYKGSTRPPYASPVASGSPKVAGQGMFLPMGQFYRVHFTRGIFQPGYRR